MSSLGLLTDVWVKGHFQEHKWLKDLTKARPSMNGKGGVWKLSFATVWQARTLAVVLASW